MNELINRLQIVMDKYKTQTAFAEDIGVSTPMVTNWIKGRVVPRRSTLLKISEKTGVSPEWLINGVGQPFVSEEEKKKNLVQIERVRVRQGQDATLDKMLREKFKRQCSLVFFDDFFDFIAEYYGESQNGAERFLLELETINQNYRHWLASKKNTGENHTIPPSGTIISNGF